MGRAVALGFRAKTGRAIGVALARTAAGAPELLWRGEVGLLPPDYPYDEGPYHTVMELPWERAVIEVRPLVDRIEAAAREALAPLIARWKPRAIGVVGSPNRALEKIGNFHIRAHAAEGVLFRRVIEEAAAFRQLTCCARSEKYLPHLPQMKELGRQAGPPWRADERAAATAAWLALS